MLERMREFSKNWVMKVLLGLVGLSFVAYFGYVPFQAKQEQQQYEAISVNGRMVTTNEFARLYESQIQELTRRQGVSPYEQQQLQVAQGVKDLLISQALQENWIEQIGLKITDEEVKLAIQLWWNQNFQNIPLTPQAYARMLASQRLSVAGFEALIRQDLTNQKARNLIAQHVHVPQTELKEEFIRRQRQVKVRAVAFKPEEFMDQIETNPDQLKEFYNNRQER